MMDQAKTRVLLIEENGKSTAALQDVISEVADAGFAMERTNQLASGLKRLTQGGVDLVVMDVNIPGDPGMEG